MSDWRAAVDAAGADPASVRPAVKAVLAAMHRMAPGRSVEVRVPPHGAIQVIEGPVHRRGTPKATVELAPEVLFELATGSRTWADAVSAGDVLASGERTDLSRLFPLDPTAPQ